MHKCLSWISMKGGEKEEEGVDLCVEDVVHVGYLKFCMKH